MKTFLRLLVTAIGVFAMTFDFGRYDDGMLVFDLAKPGEAVTMTAIWE